MITQDIVEKVKDAVYAKVLELEDKRLHKQYKISSWLIRVVIEEYDNIIQAKEENKP